MSNGTPGGSSSVFWLITCVVVGVIAAVVGWTLAQATEQQEAPTTEEAALRETIQDLESQLEKEKSRPIVFRWKSLTNDESDAQFWVQGQQERKVVFWNTLDERDLKLEVGAGLFSDAPNTQVTISAGKHIEYTIAADAINGKTYGIDGTTSDSGKHNGSGMIVGEGP